jgi:ParB-like chromosome segregation protein Spo0J
MAKKIETGDPPVQEKSVTIPPMELETWPIGRLIPYAKNAKKHSQGEIDGLVVSLKEYGFRRAFVAEENGVIVIGHRMRLAAIQLGISDVPVNVARGLSAAQIKALRLADNKLNDAPEYDPAMLGAELLDLNSIGFDLSLTGFEMSEVADMVSGLFGGGSQANSNGKKKLPGESMSEDGLKFRVVVDATSESHQAELLQKFKGEGLKAKALIS